MKNIIITIITLILLLISDKAEAQIRYGIKGGAQLTNVQYYHPFSSPRFGFQLGGLAYMPLNDAESIYFQPEVSYLQHGEKNTGSSANLDEKYYLDYIAVPLMFKFYVSDHYNTFFAELGPQIAFNIIQKSSTNKTELSAFNNYGLDAENVNFLDISLGAGLGFTYERKWEIGVRYNYGFTDVYPDTVGENQAKTNNSSNLSFSIIYLFD